MVQQKVFIIMQGFQNRLNTSNVMVQHMIKIMMDNIWNGFKYI